MINFVTVPKYCSIIIADLRKRTTERKGTIYEDHNI